MEFVKNNIAIFISTAIVIISGCFNVYQYIENKKLRKYGTEKDLKRRKASLEKLRNEHRSNNWMLVTLGEKEKEKNEFVYREKCLLAEIDCLEKILKIKK
jgi:hypothetical protein